MLRSLDEKFGIGVYTQNIIDALLKEERAHQYVLLYRNKEHMGRFAHYPNVAELLVNAPNKLLWDQVAVPLTARRAKVDVLFHTKFTVPFLARCRTVMVVHGASWFVRPELYENKLDLTYVKMMMPLYCRKADAIISNSNLTTADFVKLLHVPPKKIRTVYYGLNPIFRPIHDREILDSVKKEYDLPDRFILTVSRYDPRKNFCTIFKAFAKSCGASDVKLVAVGKNSWKYRDECHMSESGLQERVVFPGYVEQTDLPAIYSLAEAFVFPSVYEEFGIPLIEAMACGCPVVGANTGAMPEITDGAAFLADPFDADRLAQGIQKFMQNADFRQTSVEKGLERAKDFSWGEAAQKTLDTLESMNGGS
jgi:glycosyltransferase involved in cell wall biosynthesis